MGSVFTNHLSSQLNLASKKTFFSYREGASVECPTPIIHWWFTGVGGTEPVFFWGEGSVFFPLTFFLLPVTFLEKRPVTSKTCPWRFWKKMPVTFQILKFQKYPTMMIFLFCARDIFARDIEKMPVTILRKMPVTSKKCPWQISKIKCHGHKKTHGEKTNTV